MLTGKCKENFEKWYRECQNRKEDIPSLKSAMPWFYSLDFSMQYGVYVDFFDSVGIYLELTKFYDNWECEIWTQKEDVMSIIFDSSTIGNSGKRKNRNEARTKAIEKANEIYNQNK